jgi:hypothetical protein
MAGSSPAPLRILYITTSASDPATDGELLALAQQTRTAGGHLLAVLLAPPLPTTEVALLDAQGVRWVYMPLPAWHMAARRSGWRALLRRFRPDAIQFAATVTAPSIAHVQRLLPARLRPTITTAARTLTASMAPVVARGER